MIKKYTTKLMLTLLALMVGTVANAAVKLTIGQVENAVPGSTIEIPVYLENDAAVATVGFDVRFPSGISALEMVKNNDRAKGSQGWVCDIKATQLNPGAFRAGLMSLSGKTIAAGNGVIATIIAKCADVFEVGAVELENVEVTLADGTQAEVEPQNGDISATDLYQGTMKFTSEPTLEVYPGTTFTVQVALENDIELKSFQSNLTLPDGFSVVLNEEEDEYEVFGSDRNPSGVSYFYNGGPILSMVNFSGDPIVGESGVLFSFNVTAPTTMNRESVITIKGFKGQIKGQTTSFGFNSDITITVYNRNILDYEDAQAAVADLQKAFDDAKAGIEEKFLDDLEEDINEIENDINGEQGLKAIANPEELNPDFSLVDFQQAVADELEKIQALADKAADMKEKNDQHNTDLNGQIEDLQKALNAVKEKVEAFDPVPEAFTKEAAAIQDAINGLTEAVKAAFDEGDLVDKTELPENTVAADTKNLDNYADAAKAADDLQAALDQAKKDMEEKFLDNLEEDIDAIQDAVNELEAAAKPEELADIFDKDVFDKAAEDVQKAIDKLNADAAAMKAANDKAYEDLMAQINPEIPNRFNEAKQNIKTACPDVAPEFFNSQEEGVPSRVDEIQNMIDELVDMVQRDFDNGDLEAESTIADEKKAILDAIDQLEADATAAQKKFDDNKNGYLALNKELDALKKGLEDAKKAIEEMENVTGEDFADEIKDIEDDIQALEDYLEERNANRELTLQSTLDAPDVTKKEVEDELAALNKAAAELNAARSFIAGDINKDGKVDSDDLALFINALSTNKLPAAGSEDFARYDANGNGVINIADAQAIFNLSLYGNAEGKK